MEKVHQIVNRQVQRWNLERAAFENVSRNESSTIHMPETKPIVTISRQRGCRGPELVKLLAHKLHYGFFDRNIVDYIAQNAGVRRELVESLDERERSELEIWVESILRERIFDRNDYIRALSEVFKTAFLQGGIIILGRGANFLLRNLPALHVRIVASEEARIRNMLELEGMSANQARDEIKTVDYERAQFVRRYFKKDIEDPLAYDLIINMGTNTIDAAVEIILTALRKREWISTLKKNS